MSKQEPNPLLQILTRKYAALWAIVVLILLVAAITISFVIGINWTKVNQATPSPTQTPSFPGVRTATATTVPTTTQPPPPTGTATYTPTPTHTPTYTPTPTPTPRVIIVEVRLLGRLETAKYMMSTIIDLEREPSNLWEEVLGTDKLLLVAEGEVVAGFDMTLVNKEDIVVRGHQVILTLPPPQILYSKVDNEKTYVYERTTGLFQSPDPRIESEARVLAERAMIDRALEGEILKQAETNGLMQIEAFLRALGFTDITINVRQE